MPIEFSILTDNGRPIELEATNRGEVLDELLAYLNYELREVVTPTEREGVTYTKREHIQFIQDMEAQGHDVRLYQGYNFYRGPAVEVERLDEVETSVPIKSDPLGLDMIVFPVKSDSKLERRFMLDG